MTAVAIDWDDTLVTNGDWLPGAERALIGLRRARYEIIIHSCRAAWPEGRAEIEAKLASARLSGLRLEAKPDALAYIDNRAIHFDDWVTVLRQLRTMEAR